MLILMVIIKDYLETTLFQSLYTKVDSNQLETTLCKDKYANIDGTYQRLSWNSVVPKYIC